MVQADVKLPAVIGDNMVLQRGLDLQIWGWADVGEEVTVQLCDRKATATANDQGKWLVTLKALPEGGPFEMTVKGKNTITLKNVLIGEVWVCSGQSNMGMPVRGSSTAEEAIAGAKFPKIRLFKVDLTPSVKPREDCKAEWKLCSPETVPGFSAAGYYFGREIHKELKVPVGLIQNAWGGTPAEAYTSLEALESEPSLKPIADRFKTVLEKVPDLKDNYGEYFKKWNKAFRAYRKELFAWRKQVQKAKAEGKKRPRPPKRSKDMMFGSKNAPSVLFNGMVMPVIPYAIRGAIWYQGEANASRAYAYRTLFPTMIKCWRAAWGEGDFPFLFVQLPNFHQPVADPGESTWAEIREAFAMTLSLPNTGMAVTIDIGEADNIHPKNKVEVGKRLALCALGTVYGKDIVYSGPMYDSMKVEGNKIVVKFKHVGGGLEAKGGVLKQFAIAGEDKKFVWADAKIKGNDTVVVCSDKVARPVAVRYAWADNPEGCNLYNKEGLPASPFRTDDWAGITWPKK
ncbi:MAG: sialate O-acetylesterase [Planctomycetes bacterium]|nr:sialate O-acetylesterase [Planctomycetota bacterium]